MKPISTKSNAIVIALSLLLSSIALAQLAPRAADPCTYAPRPANDCGTTQSTIAARINDCAAANPATSTWDGAAQCEPNQFRGAWKLVARDGANKEVWQDQSTGLLWSSIVAQSVNWCQASGDTSGLGSHELYSCEPGAPSKLQPASPLSYCVEALGVTAPLGEDWVAGSYMAAKGRLGKNVTPAVSWQLPTIDDFKRADANGIWFVMPDMGVEGSRRPTPDASPGGHWEWSASVLSSARSLSWMFLGTNGLVSNGFRNGANPARCVGR
jgi:hypothetical protein